VPQISQGYRAADIPGLSAADIPGLSAADIPGLSAADIPVYRSFHEVSFKTFLMPLGMPFNINFEACAHHTPGNFTIRK
jgi:hypothetical protein